MEKEIYLSILDGINEGIYFVDKERKIIFWNQTAEKITGFSRLEVQGTYCFNNILNHKDEEGRNLVENKDFCVEDKIIKVTISIGATLVKEMDNLEDLLKRADEGVYLAKKNGRNRVEFKK